MLDKTPKAYDSWQAFWEAKAGEHFSRCAGNCTGAAEVAAHVQRTDEEKKEAWYVVPLCRACTYKTLPFDVQEEDLQRVTKEEIKE